MVWHYLAFCPTHAHFRAVDVAATKRVAAMVIDQIIFRFLFISLSFFIASHLQARNEWCIQIQFATTPHLERSSYHFSFCHRNVGHGKARAKCGMGISWPASFYRHSYECDKNL